MSRRQGCWVAFARCFNSKANDERILFEKKSTNTIEFENLVTAERREVETRRSRQVVTEAERDYAMSGNFEQLLEEQRRIDAEKDAELRRQEEELRQEQEAYYTAKRAAAKRSRHSPQTVFPEAGESTDQPGVSFNFPSQLTSTTSLRTQPKTTPTSTMPAAPPSSTTTRTVKTGGHGILSQPHPWHTTTSFSTNTATSSDSGLSAKDKDDLDFDEFLESVKARQKSMTNAVSPGPVKPPAAKDSDSEEEIDFGFWEKASPVPGQASDQLQTRTEADLNLL